MTKNLSPLNFQNLNTERGPNNSDVPQNWSPSTN